MKTAERVSRPPLVQIAFPIPPDDGGGMESLWAVPLDEPFEFRLANTPLWVPAIGNEDVVSARVSEGRLLFDQVVRRGGHSTYRIALRPDATAGRPAELLGRLEQNKLNVEGWSPRFFAIDVPPESDIYAVYEILQEGLDDGTWWFDEMHVGHKLREPDE
jgi:hypothetical protein